MVAQKAKVTIFDVAKASGVSSSAVSYALNGKPGVSDATREKVLQVARKLGWRPNGAAQSLAQSRTRRIGLVLGYDPQLLSAEPYIMRLISGLGSALEERDYSLLVRMSMDDDDEVSILEDWIATGNVDALLLLNLEIGDPRIELMKNNPQMPCLALADSSLTSGLPTLMSDDAAASGTMIRHLALFGHKNIARVAGPEELGHSYIRDAAFSEITTELGMRYRCLHTDYTPESGAEATKRLLSVEPRPTAIIYDNDVMALAGGERRLGEGCARARGSFDHLVGRFIHERRRASADHRAQPQHSRVGTSRRPAHAQAHRWRGRGERGGAAIRAHRARLHRACRAVICVIILLLLLFLRFLRAKIPATG
ncbi:regulatory protein, LacI [Bifidobacterium animalis subsp. animalis]|nr:regulatory protein, LacI [Bifidobacterium animalis subsp. animalis]